MNKNVIFLALVVMLCSCKAETSPEQGVEQGVQPVISNPYLMNKTELTFRDLAALTYLHARISHGNIGPDSEVCESAWKTADYFLECRQK